MRRTPYILAVDGGNTKTLAVVIDRGGAIRGVGMGGCSDIYNATPTDDERDPAAAALANAMRAITAALDTAQVGPLELAVTVFNMAGADWPEDIAFWREAATARGLGEIIIVQNDALGVLYGASPSATGVSIVAGTGVATGARAADGTVWHSSFWQDEAQGSSHLGQSLLYAVYRSALELAPPTTLTARVLDLLGVPTVEATLHLFHNRLQPAPIRVDRLAPIVLDEAHAGDDVALHIVRAHASALGDMALVAARHVGLVESAFSLVLAGGLFRHPTTVLEDAIVAQVRLAAPNIQPIRSTGEPIVGVIVEALKAAGEPITSALIARLTAAFPTAAPPLSAVELTRVDEHL